MPDTERIQAVTCETYWSANCVALPWTHQSKLWTAAEIQYATTVLLSGNTNSRMSEVMTFIEPPMGNHSLIAPSVGNNNHYWKCVVRVELLQEQGNYVKRTVETLRGDVVADMTVAYWTSESWGMFTLAKAERFYFLSMGQVPFRSVKPSKNPMVPMAKKLELLQMLEHVLFVYQNTNRKRNQRSPPSNFNVI